MMHGVGATCVGVRARVPGASADAIKLEVRLLRVVEQGALTDALAGELIAELRGILTRGGSQRQLSWIRDYVELLQILADRTAHAKKGFRPEAPRWHTSVTLRGWQDAT